MSKTEAVVSDAKRGVRLLDGSELDAVGGGIKDEENFIQDEEYFGKCDITATALGRIARGA
jgi:hypothetical protein